MSAVLTRIERELRDVWAAPAVPGEPVKSRACTMNLVVVAQSRELAAKYTPVVDEVTAAIPARAILVALQPDAPSSALDGDATAVCAVAPGAEGAICSERITLVASGTACLRVASAVDALSVPEIQTTLVWLGRVHVDDPIFLSLASGAQRVVLDTEYTSLASLVKLAAWTRAAPGRPAVADLAWTRLAIWQELTARFFDPPELRDHADRVNTLVLRQASREGARLGPEGMLFLGWMATRLGWAITRLAGASRFKRRDGGQVALALEAVRCPSGVGPEALTYVAVVAEASGLAAKGSIERRLPSDPAGVADALTWKLEVALPAASEQCVRLHTNKEAALLIQTLHRPVHDAALFEAIDFAEQLAEDGLVCP